MRNVGYYYFDLEMYEESKRSAKRAVEVDPYYDCKFEWLYREIEKAESN